MIALISLPNIYAIVNNYFFFHYNKTLIFKNPEAEPYTMYFRQKDAGNTLVYFVSRNYTNGTIGGFVTEADIGNYDLECVGVDDAGWETVISF